MPLFQFISAYMD